MARAFIPSFGTKDPDDSEPKNFDASLRMLKLGNPELVSPPEITAVAYDVQFGDAVLAEAEELVITDVVWDSVTKRVSFVWSGGTFGVRYLVTCRLPIGPTTHIDQSAYVTIDNH